MPEEGAVAVPMPSEEKQGKARKPGEGRKVGRKKQEAGKEKLRKPPKRKPALLKVEPSHEKPDTPGEDVDVKDIDLQDTTFQYRFPGSVADLQKSLERDGQQEPIDLRKGKKPYQVLDGFRRCRGAVALNWSSIKAVFRELTDDQAHRFALIKNAIRKNLSPMEKAHALWQAMQRGIKKDALATEFSMSEKQVSRYLELLSFSSQLQKLLDGKTITMAHAKTLHDFAVEDCKAWCDRIASEQLDRRQLQKLLKADGFTKAKTKKRFYLKQTKDTLRVYPFKVSKDTPSAEREKIAKLLKEALTFVLQQQS